mmetsp:Transcript_116250/g.323790  ORF Transcript_116250/g.323790 Transcript_116250/m.323790 type:complete len:160 (-) Transcript_116250:26-505(-)
MAIGGACCWAAGAATPTGPTAAALAGFGAAPAVLPPEGRDATAGAPALCGLLAAVDAAVAPLWGGTSTAATCVGEPRAEQRTCPPQQQHNGPASEGELLHQGGLRCLAQQLSQDAGCGSCNGRRMSRGRGFRRAAQRCGQAPYRTVWFEFGIVAACFVS